MNRDIQDRCNRYKKKTTRRDHSINGLHRILKDQRVLPCTTNPPSHIRTSHPLFMSAWRTAGFSTPTPPTEWVPRPVMRRSGDAFGKRTWPTQKHTRHIAMTHSPREHPSFANISLVITIASCTHVPCRSMVLLSCPAALQQDVLVSPQRTMETRCRQYLQICRTPDNQNAHLLARINALASSNASLRTLSVTSLAFWAYNIAAAPPPGPRHARLALRSSSPRSFCP